jgi:basic membrane protein A
MRVRYSATLFAILVLPLLVGACGLTQGGCQPEHFRVGMVSNVSGVDEAGHNKSTWQGLQRAKEELPVCAQLIESRTLEDYEKDITEFAEQQYDLIITIGEPMADATAKMAEVYPDTKMAIIDHAPEPSIPNVAGIVFDVDEAAFLGGYLAAAWADLMDPSDPHVGWVGGIQNTTEEQYVSAYEAGVAHYNERNITNVQVLGEYVGTRQDAVEGKGVANALIDAGADVLFGIGGETGEGGLVAAKERGKWGLGADLDQYGRLPEVSDILISSCIKRPDQVAYAVARSITRAEFDGGAVYHGTLENGGVGLAPFHDFEDRVPDQVRRDLDEIRQGIIDGTIDAGW